MSGSGKNTIKKLFGKRFAAGSWSMAAAAVVIVMAVVANLIAGSLPAATTQIDMTQDSIYSLSDQTKRIAASLDPVALDKFCLDQVMNLPKDENNDNEALLERINARHGTRIVYRGEEMGLGSTKYTVVEVE